MVNWAPFGLLLADHFLAWYLVLLGNVDVQTTLTFDYYFFSLHGSFFIEVHQWMSFNKIVREGRISLHWYNFNCWNPLLIVLGFHIFNVGASFAKLFVVNHCSSLVYECLIQVLTKILRRNMFACYCSNDEGD